MPSTFFGLTIGGSALHSFSGAVTATANNIANVKTEGYSRQVAHLEATGPIRVPAKYGSMGTGVTITQIKQERDLYYDAKYWENNSSLGYYEKKLYYMENIETVFADDSVNKGFSTIFNAMFNALDSLKTNSGDVNHRQQFVGNAQSLCTYFNDLYTRLSEMQDDINEEIKSEADEINSIGKKIALINREINKLETGTGAYANELRDERAKLLDELSEFVYVETREFEIINSYGDNLGGTSFSVYINGQTLVDNYDFRQLECKADPYRVNQSDVDGLYKIVWTDTGMDFAATTGCASGNLKALFDMRDGDNKENLSGKIESSGFDADGNGSIKISGLNIEDIKALNIAEHDGTIKIGSRYFHYDNFDMTFEGGKLTAIEFKLNKESSQYMADEPVVNGDVCTSGSGVDSMGIPYYMAQMNMFIRNFSKMFNDLEIKENADGKRPVDLNGDYAEVFFTATLQNGECKFDTDEKDGTFSSRPDPAKDDDGNVHGTYYFLTAQNYTVNNATVKSPSKFATTVDHTSIDKNETVVELLKLQSGVNVFRGDKASSFLETLISDTSVDTQKAEIFYNNFYNLGRTIENQRTSVSGVDQDEEAMNLVKYQNAYNLASKMISVMAEMYDKLINETGR